MKKAIIVIIIIVPIFIYAQINEKSEYRWIVDMKLSNAKRIKFIGNDYTEILNKRYESKKYKVKCKEAVPTMFSRTGQGGYLKGKFHYEIFVINDSSFAIRDALIRSISQYLNSPNGLIRKNMFTHGKEFILFLDKGKNDYGDYLLYWYKNNVYKIVLCKSRVLFWKEIGGLYDIDIQFITSDGKEFFPYEFEGVQAYERINDFIREVKL